MGNTYLRVHGRIPGSTCRIREPRPTDGSNGLMAGRNRLAGITTRRLANAHRATADGKYLHT